MSVAIKKMLADRARVAENRKSAGRLDRKWDRIVADVMAMIDKAAPFIDEDADATKWPPSALLKIAYFVAATSSREASEKRALLFILAMLDKARKRFVEGFHPDPWPEPPRQRIPFVAPSNNLAPHCAGGAAIL